MVSLSLLKLAPVDINDVIERRLIDVAANVRLNVGQNLSQRDGSLPRQVLQDGVKLEHFAVDVQLRGDIDSLEKIEAEVMEIVEIGFLPGLAVPKDALEPLELPPEKRDVSVGLDDLHTEGLDLPHHFDQDFDAFCFDDFFPDFLEDVVELGGVLACVLKLLIVFGYLLEKGIHVLFQDDPGLHGEHLELCRLVGFELGGGLGPEGFLDLGKK